MTSSQSNLLQIEDDFFSPNVGLAAFTYDNQQLTTEVFTNYLKRGGKVIEIAELFTNYQCLNAAMKKLSISRDQVTLIFKVWPQDQNPEELQSRIESFLYHSQWQYFDIILIHAPICLQYRYEQWKALENMKKSKLAKSIGVANMSLNQLMTVMKNCDLLPSVFQVEVSTFHQQRDVTDYCYSSNITVINNEPNAKRTRNQHEVIQGLAKELKTSPDHLMFRWSVSKGYLTLIPPHLHLSFFSSTPYSAPDNHSLNGGDSIASNTEDKDKSAGTQDIFHDWKIPLSKSVLKQLDELDEEYLSTWAPVVEEDS